MPGTREDGSRRRGTPGKGHLRERAILDAAVPADALREGVARMWRAAVELSPAVLTPLGLGR